jgi:hypothetical protein
MVEYRDCVGSHEMAAKLHINVPQGIIDVEGDEELVRAIYADFRTELPEMFGSNHSTVEALASTADVAGARRTKNAEKRQARRRRSQKAPNGNDAAAEAYLPQLLKDLDLAKLSAFYRQFEPKNHAERVLIFAKFFGEEHARDFCSADEIYTCYMKLKERVPKVFIQAIRDAHGRKYGFVDYESPARIRVTQNGEIILILRSSERTYLNERCG